MRDFYLYDDCPVLKNKLGIKNQKELDAAEADYVVYRLRQLVVNPLKGDYDYRHLLQMHFFIFQDLYDWAGQQRKLNIYKEEPVLGGLSVEYSDVVDIEREAEIVLKEMTFKDWNNMDIKSKSTKFADSLAKLWKIHCFSVKDY